MAVSHLCSPPPVTAADPQCRPLHCMTHTPQAACHGQLGYCAGVQNTQYPAYDNTMACCYNRPTALEGSTDSVAQSFYFATIRDAVPAGSMRRGSSCWIPNSGSPVPPPPPSIPGMPVEVDAFAAVALGPLLGQGGSGHVFRGSWNGATVAVKVNPRWMNKNSPFLEMHAALLHSMNRQPHDLTRTDNCQLVRPSTFHILVGVAYMTKPVDLIGCFETAGACFCYTAQPCCFMNKGSAQEPVQV